MQRRQFLNTTSGGADTLVALLPRAGIAVLLSVACMVEVGFHEPPLPGPWLTAIRSALLLGLWAAHGTAWLLEKNRLGWVRAHTIELSLLIGASIFLFAHWAWSMGLIALLVIYILAQAYLALAQLVIRFSLLFVGSFALLILIGALLLMLPRATPAEKPISFLDAVFTSTSAVCVTGLIVRDTATEFTRFGQTIILILIQLGGLGIIIFGALLATMLSGSMSVRHASNLGEAVSAVESGPGNVERLVRFVVVATIVTEAVGAALLYAGWRSSRAGEDPTVLFDSVFMSISAFCNAGFSIYSDNLESFRHHWTSHAVIAPLIVGGGLGFPVLYNLWKVLETNVRRWMGRCTTRSMHRDRLVRLNLHTRLVLVTTVAVYLLGVLGLFGGQLATPQRPDAAGAAVAAGPATSMAAAEQSLSQRLLDASFMSITARTAGFNTMRMDELTAGSRFVLMMLMWVGGSPGGTAGGVKTTVVAILLLTILATLRNRDETEIFGRSLPDALVRRSGALVMLGFVVVAATTMCLTITEAGPFAHHVFEAVSATSTVGLSLGLTADLTPVGRVIIIAAMFLGRVGPLALIGAVVFARAEKARYRYPSEPVMLG